MRSSCSAWMCCLSCCSANVTSSPSGSGCRGPPWLWARASQRPWRSARLRLYSSSAPSKSCRMTTGVPWCCSSCACRASRRWISDASSSCMPTRCVVCCSCAVAPGTASRGSSANCACMSSNCLCMLVWRSLWDETPARARLHWFSRCAMLAWTPEIASWCSSRAGGAAGSSAILASRLSNRSCVAAWVSLSMARVFRARLLWLSSRSMLARIWASISSSPSAAALRDEAR
mmetsp:Transcript_8389/g.23640  ORF Transcript_8389/g.23640 Transcript_8389/m.23640 type:complete len:231 (+) Transcript_8389:1597-2289(+)